MIPITKVDDLKKLSAGGCVGYYSAAFGAKEFAIAKVAVDPDRIVLKQIDSVETLVLPSWVYRSDTLEDVSIEMTPEKWAELGLSGEYSCVNKINPNPKEIIFILNEDEVRNVIIEHI